MDLLLPSLVARAENASSTASASASEDNHRPPIFKVVGIILAVSSGLFIGTSFVLKKTGLLKANIKYGEEAGEGYGYLRNAWWWSGMILMIIGEICNFVAYAFVDAILVTPLGALSVVVTTILSAIFLKERLSFVGKVGCFMCIVGSVIIVLNTPEQSSAATIQDMKNYVISPGFLSYAGVIIVGCTFIAVWAGPRYGKKSMLVYLSICSLIGGLSVVATQGLGAAIVTQIQGTPQFNNWFLYVLLIFVVSTLLTEIIYLNKALNIFNAALVTPTYYVYFTSATIVTSAILFRGFKGSAIQITTIVLGFLQICAGVILLQLSKSAKDVPDAAVFKGDLDQVRTVAEQEEHESEPKADAIRGTAAILRSLSKTRNMRAASEAKRVQEERLEPIGENEQIEWDGIRRRKTVLENNRQGQLMRTKSVHYPLGMSYFPEESADGAGEHQRTDLGHSRGFLPSFRTNRRSTAASDSSVISGNLTGMPSRAVPLADLKVPGGQESNRTPSISSPNGKTVAMPNFQHEETEYKSPSFTSIQYAGSVQMQVDGQAPVPPPHAQAQRQFSFQNVFSRSRNASSSKSVREDDRPQTSSSRGSFFGFRRLAGTGATEEERLGLVHGDRNDATPQIQEPSGRVISEEPEELSEPEEMERRKMLRLPRARNNHRDDFDDDDFKDRYSDESDGDESTLDHSAHGSAAHDVHDLRGI